MKIFIIVLLLVSDIFAQKYPTTISESVDSLLKVLSVEDKALIKHTLYKNLYMFHHGFGTWIRNNFGLWGDNDSLIFNCAKSKESNFIHPDDASGIIIDSLWNKLQKQNIDYKIPSSIILRSDIMDSNRLNKLLNYIPYPDLAWRGGIDSEFSVIIETDPKNKIENIEFSPIKTDAGFSYQIDKSIRDNWNEIIHLLELKPNSKFVFALIFNSIGKKFEEYSQK